MVADYTTIRKELELYSNKLKHKPTVVALNKCDALTEEEIAEKKAALQQVCNDEIFIISAVAVHNLQACLHAVNGFITRLCRVHKNDSPAEETEPQERKPWSPLD